MKLTPSGVILLGALALALTAKGQSGYISNPNYESLPAKQQHIKEDTTLTVMLEIVLTNQTSMHFFRKGYKRGEQYWYLDGHRIRPLPKNWFVWEWKIIKL